MSNIRHTTKWCCAVLVARGVMCELGPHLGNNVREIRLQIYISFHILTTVPGA